jgi:hypothetical protein
VLPDKGSPDEELLAWALWLQGCCASERLKTWRCG